MEAIINLLTPGQVEFIISTYGSVADWIAQYGSSASIAIEDMIL